MAITEHARARVLAAPLNQTNMARELRQILPKRNDIGLVNYAGLLTELAHFGIVTRAGFRRLMLRHRRQLIAVDRTPLDAMSERAFRNEFGDAYINNRFRRQYWFSWEAMTRFALEFEFGELYRVFAEKRDGV
jgi:hypothetical protein